MRIIGLYGDEALLRFSPTQYVNVWDAMMSCFVSEARMDSLPEDVAGDPESYFIEPTTEDGTPISLRQALGYVN